VKEQTIVTGLRGHITGVYISLPSEESKLFKTGWSLQKRSMSGWDTLIMILGSVGRAHTKDVFYEHHQLTDVTVMEPCRTTHDVIWTAFSGGSPDKDWLPWNCLTRTMLPGHGTSYLQQ